MAELKKKLKWVLLSIIVVIVGITAVIFIHYRHTTQEPEKIVSNVPTGQDAVVGRIKQTSTKNGKKEWSLDAESVQYASETKEAIFKDLKVTFYLEDNKQVYLSADHGILKTQLQDFEVSGNVVVRNENYELKTDRLRYQHQQRLFSTQTPVEIEGKPFNLAANSLSVDLNSKKSMLQGGVKGVFHGQILFR